MVKKVSGQPAMGNSQHHHLDARPDTLDFRDLMYTPTLVEVPTSRSLADYRKAKVPILDQGQEGACTGFGLATVVHFLLRVRKRVPDAGVISPYMLYDMARRYDEWAGENYEGSSCRGALKGWHKHGVCNVKLWQASEGGALSEQRANDAARRPLGAYFRVNHRDLVAMHAAITEVGVLYVSSNVHSGWDQAGSNGEIGLVSEDSALQRIADYRQPMLDAECYPLAFIWHSDAWTTIKNLLEDATSQRRPEGFLDASKDFMLDRLDDALEPLARLMSSRAMWTEMKENAMAATVSHDGGARQVLDELGRLVVSDPSYEFHIVGHSAGSIFHAPLVQYLATSGAISGGPMDGQIGLGLKVESATLWAPAITTDLFKKTWLPTLNNVSRFAIFTLDDQTEQDDDCAGIYHKSLLYLVSNAFEDTFRVPLDHPDGEPILGMQKFINTDSVLKKLFGTDGQADWVIAPNTNPEGSATTSGAKHHGAFDDDKPTVLATLARVLNKGKAASLALDFKASGQRNRATRRNIDQMSDFSLTR